MLLVLGLGVWGVNAWLGSHTRHGESLDVPDLKGIAVSKAVTILEERGLRFEVRDSVFFEEMPRMSITDQNPASGSKVKKGRIIYLTVNASDPPEVEVPNMVDQSIRQAESSLELLGLRNEITYKPDVSDGVVLDQKTKAGTRVLKGAIIKLTVSKNDEEAAEVETPDLKGLTMSEAKPVLEEWGLTWTPVFEDGSDTANATIYRQNPSRGKTIKQGSQVDLFLRND